MGAIFAFICGVLFGWFMHVYREKIFRIKSAVETELKK